MVDDVTRRLESTIKKMQRQIIRLLSGRFLENSSITNGRLRLIASVLRLDSGALLELIGEWRFFGNGAITGDVYSEGKWTQVGPWEFTGDGKIFGNVEVLDDGRIKVGNVIISPEGNGRITVGIGGAQIVIDGSTGKILAGLMEIDPADGGAVAFPGGAKLQADPGGGVRLIQGTNRVYVGAGLVSIQMGSRYFGISSSGFTISGLPTIASDAANGASAGTVWADVSGQMYRVIP